MSTELGMCRRCRSEIAAAATRCPECGYEPAGEGSAGRTLLLVVGALLTVTVVGAIVGVPMMLYAFYARSKARARRPAVVPQ